MLAGSCPHLQAGSLRSLEISLCPGMKFPVHRFQSLLIDMRVNLCRRNIGMAKHFLNDAQISAIPQ